MDNLSQPFSSSASTKTNINDADRVVKMAMINGLCNGIIVSGLKTFALNPNIENAIVFAIFLSSTYELISVSMKYNDQMLMKRTCAAGIGSLSIGYALGDFVF